MTNVAISKVSVDGFIPGLGLLEHQLQHHRFGDMALRLIAVDGDIIDVLSRLLWHRTGARIGSGLGIGVREGRFLVCRRVERQNLLIILGWGLMVELYKWRERERGGNLPV